MIAAHVSPSSVPPIVLHVDVRLVRRRHHHLRALRHRGRHAVALPLLHDGGGPQPPATDLLPSHVRLAVVVDDVLHALDELHVLRQLQHVHLVAAEVDVGARRHRRELLHHVIDELVHPLAVGAEDAPSHLRARVHPRRLRPAEDARCRATAAELRVRRDRRVRVARHVDLGDDRDVAVLRVAHEVRVLRLRVEAARSAAHLGE